MKDEQYRELLRVRAQDPGAVAARAAAEAPDARCSAATVG